jgi:hypothetical protein
MTQTVLIEDRQESELSASAFTGQLAGQKPGVRLVAGVLALGGRKAELRLTGYQLKRVPTPVIAHGGPTRLPIKLLFCYVSSNSELNPLVGRRLA